MTREVKIALVAIWDQQGWNRSMWPYVVIWIAEFEDSLGECSESIKQDQSLNQDGVLRPCDPKKLLDIMEGVGGNFTKEGLWIQQWSLL